MLYDRMQRVRSAARFVFRNHPDIVRQATSTYQRSRRARHRRDNTTVDALSDTTTA